MLRGDESSFLSLGTYSTVTSAGQLVSTADAVGGLVSPPELDFLFHQAVLPMVDDVMARFVLI